MFAIYTTELIDSRKRRMPWRTVLEIARHIGAVVFSGDGRSTDVEINGVMVEYVDKPFTAAAANILVGRMKEHGITRLYFPVVPGRVYRELQDACEGAEIEIVWYITSSWNSLCRVLRAWKWIGFRAVRSYLIQALIPKRIWLNLLNRRRLRPIITMSDFTARKLVECNYPVDFVHSVLPGLDELKDVDDGSCCLRSKGVPYFLFFGPPQKIRGIFLILEAAKRLNRRRNDFRLVILVRADENAKRETEELKECISRMQCCQVEARYGLVPSQEINEYINGAIAILKPFILVPSEIPLAPMEAIQRGKLVIGFEGDGTGELIGRHGIAVEHCDVDSLSESMNQALNDKFVHKAFIGESWCNVAEKWRRI